MYMVKIDLKDAYFNYHSNGQLQSKVPQILVEPKEILVLLPSFRSISPLGIHRGVIGLHTGFFLGGGGSQA